jgi:predicted Zn-dependent peptidase
MSIINLKSPTDLSGFYVVYNGSTNLEKKGIYGISHLMEHLVCKALDPYQDEMDRLGIDSNAYTSKNEIVFHLTGLDESLSKWRNKYVELLQNFDISKKEFENERMIVLQEYQDSFNEQTQNHWLNLDRKLMNSYGAIGLKDDLQNLTYLDCLNYFEKQYMSPSKIINVSKNIEFGADIEFMNNEIDIVHKLGNYDTIIDRNTEYKDKVSLILSSDIIEEDFAIINFVNLMLTYGLNSPFYQEIREKRGLVYYIGAYLSRMNKQGLNYFYTATTAENVDKICEIIFTIFDDIEKFLTKERFDTVKEALKIKYKKNDINRYSNVDKYISDKEWSVSDIIDDLSYIQVLKVAKKYFTKENYRISRDDTEFSK